MKKLLIILLGMVLLSYIVFGDCTSQNDAIMGYNFGSSTTDENRTDIATNRHNLTFTGGAIERTGFIDFGSFYDDSGPGKASVANPELFTQLSNWSFICWMNNTDGTSGGFYFSEADASTDSDFAMFGVDSSGDGGAAKLLYITSGGTDITVEGGADLPENTWVHMVFTRAGNLFRIYINGELDSTDSAAVAALNNADIQSYGLGDRLSPLNPFTGVLDECYNYNRTISNVEINESYNAGAGCQPYVVPPFNPSISVSLIAPANNTISNNQTVLFVYNTIAEQSIISNCSLLGNFSGTFTINQTNSSGINNNSNSSFTINNLQDGDFIWNVECTNNESNVSRAVRNFTLFIDTINPLIIPAIRLDANLTVVFNGTLVAQINFTDNRELFSVNISETGNGNTLFNTSNIGATSFNIALNVSVSTTVANTLNVTVCDSSTAQLIKDIDNKVDKQGLKYVMKKKFFIIDEEWIHIYPKDYNNYNVPKTNKKTDRYDFTFNKKTNPNAVETFVVESSHRIDIPKLQIKAGHLVIPDIGNGFWLDFVNIEATNVTIIRINENKVEIQIQGLKSKKISFNSIGELNCVSETFFFGNLNPTQQFLTSLLVNTLTEINLTITEDPITVRNATATLTYNVTQIGERNTSNFTVEVTTPSEVGGNGTNVSFTWTLTVNGETQTIPTASHVVNNFIVDNCTELSTQAINFTLRDETNSTLITQDLTGAFTYNIGGANKSFTFSATSVETFQICIFPNDISINADYIMTYESADRPQRTFRNPSAILTNASVEVPLFSLNDSLGIFVRFRVIDTFQNPLDDVLSEMKLTIASVLRTIESKFTDDSGLVTFFADPTELYTFVFSKSGFETTTTVLRPTAIDIFSVTLTSTEAAEVLPPSTGITYSFTPKNQILNNNTNVNFGFNLTSNIRFITNCTFFIKNGSTILSQSNTTFDNDNCNINITQNTNSFTRLIAEAQYTLNETINITISTQYEVREIFVGNFSLQTFINDVKDFTASGFDDRTRTIIAFIIIFSLTAIASSKLAVFNDPENLLVLVWVLVVFFSYIGFFILNFNTIPEITGLPEGWLKQWIISIVFSLFVGGYFINRIKR
ncbi:hypothetical protein LCGC14_0374570 [marine sediment metagenome]|uniref:LamG-like jellyroll fold domain-containing protein n=1 Tax=marine sediment metagenome TaxID=412755 RepID=A0A0F9TMA7_9ZZZZ